MLDKSAGDSGSSSSFSLTGTSSVSYSRQKYLQTIRGASFNEGKLILGLADVCRCM